MGLTALQAIEGGRMKNKLKLIEEISRIDGQIERDSKEIRALENELRSLIDRRRETEDLLKELEENDDPNLAKVG